MVSATAALVPAVRAKVERSHRIDAEAIDRGHLRPLRGGCPGACM